MIIKTYKINYKILISIISLCLLSFLICINYVNAKETDDYVEVPIIMYHSILKSKSGNYTISPTILENDLKYIKEKGYTTITMTDLINYVYNDTPIPEKSIVITFDDGYYNNLTYAVPLLEKYNMKAVISIVGSYTDMYTQSQEINPNYGYLRWEDIKNLQQAGTIEFQNHTYNLHQTKSKRKGCSKLKSESFESYKNILTSDIKKLQEEFEFHISYMPNTFTYPFGAISKDSNKILKELNFKASLSCTSGINKITKNPDCLYNLKRNNRTSKLSSEQFFKKILH